MAEYGQTGKWLILPVKLCVLMLGAYFIFSGFFQLGSMLFNGPSEVIKINGTANIFGREPSYQFLERYPESATYAVVPSLIQLHNLQLAVFCVGGLLSLLTMFCFYTFAAYSLYVLTWVYAAVYFLTHAHILQSYQSEADVILDHIPAFRGQDEYQVLFFGELKWPNSFWYQFAIQMIFKIYMIYLVSDLYYSWYLILKSGGSGWELLPANELPGWDRYQAKEKQKLEERENRRHPSMNDQQMMGPVGQQQPQLRPEDLEMLLQLLQQQGAGGGAAAASMMGRSTGLGLGGALFGDIPPQTGIPVRPA